MIEQMSSAIRKTKYTLLDYNFSHVMSKGKCISYIHMKVWYFPRNKPL